MGAYGYVRMDTDAHGCILLISLRLCCDVLWRRPGQQLLPLQECLPQLRRRQALPARQEGINSYSAHEGIDSKGNIIT